MSNFTLAVSLGLKDWTFDGSELLGNRPFSPHLWKLWQVGGATSLKGLVQKLIYLISLLNVLFESLHGLWSNDNCTGLCGNWPTLSCWCTPLTGWCRGSERWLWSPETRFLYHSCDSYSISWGWGDQDRSGAGQIRGSSCHIMLCTPSFSQTVVHLAFYRQLDVHCMGGEGREICADKICQSFRLTAFIIIFICLVKKKKKKLHWKSGDYHSQSSVGTLSGKWAHTWLIRELSSSHISLQFAEPLHILQTNPWLQRVELACMSWYFLPPFL